MTESALVLRAINLSRARFPHGFATRVGGVSEGNGRASLNFGGGDAAERVAENVRRFAHAVHFEPTALRQVTQVHGALVVDAERMPDEPAARPEADGLFLGPGGKGRARAVGVRTADCVPVLVASNDRGDVAALHAGWRGVVGGVLAAGLSAMSGQERLAAIGPCIGPCCFEVGESVAAEIVKACGDEGVVARSSGDKAFVDLRRAVAAQLVQLEVSDIEQVPGCTKCDAAQFFSYRRDGAESGRHLAVIGLRNGSTP